PAYVKSGQIANGQTASYSFTTDTVDNLNGRLTWGWGFSSLSLSLYDAAGNKIASSGNTMNGFTNPYAEVNFPYAGPGKYTLKVEGTKVSGGTVGYTLITPYQL
ncbi:MAG TPA: peptidase S8, partial [Methanocella sp.]|nr:peptidase S8 [Methanocella sp.]